MHSWSIARLSGSFEGSSRRWFDCNTRVSTSSTSTIPQIFFSVNYPNHIKHGFKFIEHKYATGMKVWVVTSLLFGWNVNAWPLEKERERFKEMVKIPFQFLRKQIYWIIRVSMIFRAFHLKFVRFTILYFIIFEFRFFLSIKFCLNKNQFLNV